MPLELSAEKLSALNLSVQVHGDLKRDIAKLEQLIERPLEEAPLVAEPPPAMTLPNGTAVYPSESELTRLGSEITVRIGAYRISAVLKGSGSCLEPGRGHHVTFGDGEDRPWLNNPEVNRVRVAAARVVAEQALSVRRAELACLEAWLEAQDVRIISSVASR